MLSEDLDKVARTELEKDGENNVGIVEIVVVEAGGFERRRNVDGLEEFGSI